MFLKQSAISDQRSALLALLLLAAVPAFAEGDAHVRVLAASCAACHGTGGNSVGGTPVLAGLDASHFRLQMNAFRTGERSATVMHHHAKGLTAEEIDRLADYFAVQPRKAASAPKPLVNLQ